MRHSIPSRTLPSRPARRTLFIQTETTPNPDVRPPSASSHALTPHQALKFKPTATDPSAGAPSLLPAGLSAPFVEYLTPRATVSGPHHRSELAGRLLAVEGVTGVFVGRDFVTVTKDPGVGWALVKPEAFALIAEAVARGGPVVETVRPRGGDAAAGAGREGEPEEPEGDSLAVAEGDSEVVAMIKELLDTRIRPAIREDGGDIEFRGFEDGVVSLKLRGACRTCDSSTVTLRNGIESMLVCLTCVAGPRLTEADALHRGGEERQSGAG